MRYSLVDEQDQSEFAVDGVAGDPVVGGLLFVESQDGRDRRIYRIAAISGHSLTVVRQPFAVANYA